MVDESHPSCKEVLEWLQSNPGWHSKRVISDKLKKNYDTVSECVEAFIKIRAVIQDTCSCVAGSQKCYRASNQQPHLVINCCFDKLIEASSNEKTSLPEADLPEIRPFKIH